jgi:hypothetical protein
MSYAGDRLAEIAAEMAGATPRKPSKALARQNDAISKRALELRRRKRAIATGLLKSDVCDCCGSSPKNAKGLALDHCHKTGELRGWLCHRCNLGIGLLGDTAEHVARAVAYLHREPIGWALRSTKNDGDSCDRIAMTASRDPNSTKRRPRRRVAGMLPWLEWIASGNYVPADSDPREDE